MVLAVILYSFSSDPVCGVSGSDGLVKIWTIKTNECVSTLDEHTEKVWSLASSADGNVLVSGGADSVICQWTVSYLWMEHDMFETSVVLGAGTTLYP